MTNRAVVIHEIVVMIASAAARERAMADHLEMGARLFNGPVLGGKDSKAWISRALRLAEASRRAHCPAPQKAPQAIEDTPTLETKL